MPEATNFVFAAWLTLAPHSLTREDVPGSFPILDFARHTDLGVKAKAASKLTIGEAPLSKIINWDQDETVPEQHKLDLLAVTYHLLGQFSELYKGLDGFIELFEPVTEIADRLKVGKLSEDLQVRSTRLSASWPPGGGSSLPSPRKFTATELTHDLCMTSTEAPQHTNRWSPPARQIRQGRTAASGSAISQANSNRHVRTQVR